MAISKIMCPWEIPQPASGPETGVPNLPSPEGAAFGRELARLTDCARADWPDVPEMCVDCAFRSGTEPNQMMATLMTAFKCAMEGEPFYCHHGEEPPCAGYLTWRHAAARMEGEATT